MHLLLINLSSKTSSITQLGYAGWEVYILQLEDYPFLIPIVSFHIINAIRCGEGFLKLTSCYSAHVYFTYINKEQEKIKLVYAKKNHQIFF